MVTVASNCASLDYNYFKAETKIKIKLIKSNGKRNGNKTQGRWIEIIRSYLRAHFALVLASTPSSYASSSSWGPQWRCRHLGGADRLRYDDRHVGRRWRCRRWWRRRTWIGTWRAGAVRAQSTKLLAVRMWHTSATTFHATVVQTTTWLIPKSVVHFPCFTLNWSNLQTN